MNRCTSTTVHFIDRDSPRLKDMEIERVERAYFRILGTVAISAILCMLSTFAPYWF